MAPLQALGGVGLLIGIVVDYGGLDGNVHIINQDEHLKVAWREDWGRRVRRGDGGANRGGGGIACLLLLIGHGAEDRGSQGKEQEEEVEGGQCRSHVASCRPIAMFGSAGI